VSTPIIEVRELSKVYRLGTIGATTLRESFHRWWGKRRGHPEPDAREFWALRNVSFAVQPGEIVGIIGRNGAGKSTLLKILSRITEPTSGRATIRGRVASLLEVGTGFHPDLTGRENVFLNGAILGMKRAEIRRKFDEIVAFAEVEQFIDTPVKRYSSGMYVRLAFAVAAHLEPEILIIDEVLAVGDATFQKKCLGKMDAVAKGGRTVLFVSHNMQAVSSLCNRALFLRAGQREIDGPAREAVSAYLMRDNAAEMLEATFNASDSLLNLVEFKVSQPAGHFSGFVTSQPTYIELTVNTAGVRGPDLICGFTVEDGQTGPVFSTYFNELGTDLPDEPIHANLHLRCTIPAHFFNEGQFSGSIDVGIAKVRRVTNDEQHRFTLDFSNPDGLGSRFSLGRNWRRGPILPLLPWTLL